MERFEGPASLAWVANSTLAITAEVRIEVTALESGWAARLVDPSEEVRWAATILDNPFELQFSDGSTVTVGISEPDADGTFTLWDWEQEGDRPRLCPSCGTAMTYDGFRIDVTGQRPDAPQYTCPHCDVEQ